MMHVKGLYLMGNQELPNPILKDNILATISWAKATLHIPNRILERFPEYCLVYKKEVSIET